MRGKKMVAPVAILLFGLLILPARAANLPADAVATVLELDALHEVIHQIWHDAVPAKNVALLRQLQPRVTEGVAKVAAAQLPGILSDKTEAWQEGAQNLQRLAREYGNAAAGSNDAALLAAATELHTGFEKQTRLVRPQIKELGELRTVLYMLEKHYLPDGRIDEVKAAGAELQRKLAALNEVTLPKSMVNIDYDFQVARGMMAGSINALAESASAGDLAGVKTALGPVNSYYRRMEVLFE